MTNKIIDIKFMNNQVYLLKENTISLADFEQQISDIKYTSVYETYKKIKDESGAEKTQFPPINKVFYSELFENGKVLPPMLLVDKYFEYYNEDFIRDDSILYYEGKNFSYSAVVGRILRSYPSLVRDFDFFLRLSQAHCFDKVSYSCRADILGKDIVIKHKGIQYEVSLYVDTVRSNWFKKIKNKYRHDYGTSEIQVPLNLSKAKKCGDFFIYDDSYIEKVKKQIYR